MTVIIVSATDVVFFVAGLVHRLFETAAQRVELPTAVAEGLCTHVTGLGSTI